MHVYITMDDFDSYIKNKLSPEDLSEYQDCTFIPLKLEFNAESDMSIDALIVPVKNGDRDFDRHRVCENNNINNFGINYYTGKPFVINPVTCQHDWRCDRTVVDVALMKHKHCYKCNICGLVKYEYEDEQVNCEHEWEAANSGGSYTDIITGNNKVYTTYRCKLCGATENIYGA